MGGIRRLRCCAKNCNEFYSSVEGGPQVFKFPKDLQRCRIWVKNSGNLELLKLPPEKLCVLRHLCAAHFTKDQFWNNTGRILKKYAVPTFFSVNPLSDNEMSEFPATRDSAVNMCTL